MPPNARNLPQQVAQIGSFMWRVKFASRFSDYLQGKTMSDLADVFTKKNSVEELIKLAKSDPSSNEAIRKAINVIVVTEGIREPEEQPIR